MSITEALEVLGRIELDGLSDEEVKTIQEAYNTVKITLDGRK